MRKRSLVFVLVLSLLLVCGARNKETAFTDNMEIEAEFTHGYRDDGVCADVSEIAAQACLSMEVVSYSTGQNENATEEEYMAVRERCRIVKALD